MWSYYETGRGDGLNAGSLPLKQKTKGEVTKLLRSVTFV